MKTYGTGTKKYECCDMRNGCCACQSTKFKYQDKKHKLWRKRARRIAKQEMEIEDLEPVELCSHCPCWTRGGSERCCYCNE